MLNAAGRIRPARRAYADRDPFRSDLFLRRHGEIGRDGRAAGMAARCVAQSHVAQIMLAGWSFIFLIEGAAGLRHAGGSGGSSARRVGVSTAARRRALPGLQCDSDDLRSGRLHRCGSALKR